METADIVIIVIVAILLIANIFLDLRYLTNKNKRDSLFRSQLAESQEHIVHILQGILQRQLGCKKVEGQVLTSSTHYLVVLWWYDTKNYTSMVFEAKSAGEAVGMALDKYGNANEGYAITNVIPL